MLKIIRVYGKIRVINLNFIVFVNFAYLLEGNIAYKKIDALHLNIF